jgi:hypothetical protein
LSIIAAAILFTSDIPLALLKVFTRNLDMITSSWLGKTESILVVRPTPLVLLVMTGFYLWVYVRRTSENVRKPNGSDQAESPMP